MRVYKYTTLEALNDALADFEKRRIKILYNKIIVKDDKEAFYVTTEETSKGRGEYFEKVSNKVGPSRSSFSSGTPRIFPQ